jgi:hypothetical protein
MQKQRVDVIPEVDEGGDDLEDQDMGQHPGEIEEMDHHELGGDPAIEEEAPGPVDIEGEHDME